MANENSGKLRKFFIGYQGKDGEWKQYMQEGLEGNDLREIKLPFTLNGFNPDMMRAQFFDGIGKPETVEDPEYFRYIISDKKDEEHRTDFEARQKNSAILQNIMPEYFVEDKEENDKFPEMTYSDVTEKDMFGQMPISFKDLASPNQGVWAYNGFRKFKIEVKNMPQDIDESSDVTRKASLYWNFLDSESIDPVFEEEIRYDKKRKCYFAYIDTNQLGETLAKGKEGAKEPSFEGRFEIHYIYTDHKKVFGFPIKILVHDTRPEKMRKGAGALLKNGFVSIDFGTSSSCAAVPGEQGKPRLITLSGIEKRDENSNDNPYENPTNLMIYDWKEVFRQWDDANENCPFVLTKSDDYNEQAAGYDSGYTVDDEYKQTNEEDGRRKMAAIMTQLKMIPYWMKHGKELKFTPYSGIARTPVMITDSVDPKDNTDKRFNPIAFYGYLLSRAINNPAAHAIYRRYQITYPVKFDAADREKIRSSLEYGIKRALPKPIRDEINKKGKSAITVEMKYSEPVACVGAIVGKQLQLEGDEQGKLFAVYDLGGGTMDFAFGIYRPVLDDNEAEIAKYAIQILGRGGDNKVGGEHLIHRIAYEIYRDNKDEMENKKIKFTLPLGEEKPDGFEGLLSERGDEIADSNVNSLKEQLARHLFQYGESVDGNLTKIEGIDAPDAETCTISLINSEDDEVTVNLKVEEIDEFIEEQISQTVDSFYHEMESTFEKHIEQLHRVGIEGFDPKSVFVFLGGNASKQHFVMEKMSDKFDPEKIKRIGEGVNKEGASKEYAITEKTAVAFGQLDLSSYVVDQTAIQSDDESAPFLYNVGYIDSGNNEFRFVLRKNDPRGGAWQKANFIDRNNLTTNLRYTESPSERPEEKELITLQEDVSDYVEDGKWTLYIRVFDEDSIEYRIGSVKTPPDDSEEPNLDMVLKLVDMSAS